MPQQVIKFNQAQRDVLNVVSLLKSDEDVKALRKVLIDFVNNRLQQELVSCNSRRRVMKSRMNSLRFSLLSFLFLLVLNVEV